MYNVANGFHNSPKHMFNDHTVRPRESITGLNSGLMVGGKAFGLGLYDAVTGLVTQPYRGYQEAAPHIGRRVLGVSKGVGKGLGGLVLKSGAAVFGPPAYALKGLEREIERWVSGTDSLTRDEMALIQKAKEQSSEGGVDTRHGSRPARLVSEEARGAGVGKRVVERRVWVGYSEIREMREQDADVAAAVEQGILERWEQLGAGTFLAGLAEQGGKGSSHS